MRRLPVRVRHYWKLLVVCAAVPTVLVVLFSTVRVAPLVTSTSSASGDRITQDVAGTEDLFDAGVAHSIKLTFRDDGYQRLLDSFFSDGKKDFLEADLTLDGTTVPSVGIRLKGNSTLSGLTRNGESRQSGFGGGRRGGGGGFGAALKAEEPENLPWLIRFDEYVEGRRYQGHREIAVRVGGEAVLNEAVSLSVLAAAGEVSQRYAYSSFVVNDRPAAARLIVEHPDENFADTIGDDGVLYKSLASSQFTDQGDDPTDYADDFKQINKKGSQDLQPVIDLIRWVNSASDADFDADLADHVDVESFARYVAVQNLLVNFDDMAGPGRNYYLWYDLTSRTFQVIGWDYNLTFSGDATQDPAESSSMGRGGFRGFQPGAQPGVEPGAQPGFEPPEGFQPPEGMEPPGGGRGFGGMGGHKLKERFLASEALKPVYRKAYKELFNKIYGNAAALNTIDAVTGVIAEVDGADQAALTAEADSLRTLIRERTQFLATHEYITG
ncbi:CotH kinase family protein [Actinoplanes sp. NPDC051861]|uniref:CotH kinase family protein n=1 Tax=Actinoplanes sp. NPDC051861 TaxID=3155170 RepID=UPI00341A48A7